MNKTMSNAGRRIPVPAPLLLEHVRLFTEQPPPGPVLDLACGDGHNGIFLAMHGIPVISCDRSLAALDRAARLAAGHGVSIQVWKVDLEREEDNPLPVDSYGGMLIFRYLHRPLIPCIKKSLKQGGILIYETFTVEQPRFGRPHNPDYLLKPGELLNWFADWRIIHYFEGVKENPQRAVAQMVCRKPV